MALVSVMSAKGAPGATTATLLLATLWPAPSMVLDADVLGADIGMRMLRSDGHAMDPEHGLMSILPAVRRGLDPAVVKQHAQEAVGGQPVIVGLPGLAQAAAAAPLWPSLADVFARVPNADMFADLGQLRSDSPHMALVERSNLLLVVYRPTAWSAVHTRRRIETMEDVVRNTGLRVGIVGVAEEDQEGDRRNAAAAIRNGLSWVGDYGSVAYDPRAVRMFEGAVVYRPERTLLARSGRELAMRVYADLADSVTAEPAAAADGQAADGDSVTLLPGANGTPHSRRGRRRGGRRLRPGKTADVTAGQEVS